jgi:hypothetical protein
MATRHTSAPIFLPGATGTRSEGFIEYLENLTPNGSPAPSEHIAKLAGELETSFGSFLDLPAGPVAN